MQENCKRCKKENGHDNKKRGKVRRTLLSTVFGTIKKCIDKYGDYDEAEERDVFVNPMEMSYQYTLDWHFFVIRADGFPELGNGIDIAIYNNGDVDITVYCYPYTTEVSLIVFDEEEDADSTVKQAREVIELLIEDIIMGGSIYHLHRYLSYCTDRNGYTWKDALRDYKELK